jgi:Lipopolysaccharide-assembly
MNKISKKEKQPAGRKGLRSGAKLPRFLTWLLGIGCWLCCFSSCKVYSFKDVSIPKEIKTIRVAYIENKARIVNPQLSPQLTDKLKQKLNNQTSLTQIPGDEADYDVSGYVSDYNYTTSGVSNQQAATNRLTVTVHIIFKNRKADQKIGTPDFEADVTRNFDFSANLSITDAESQLLPTILSNLTDEIFNRLFSNW